MKLSALSNFGGLLLYLYFINAAAWSIGLEAIDGTALGGKEENGQFYVKLIGDRGFKEVSEAVYWYSKFHTISVLITAPLCITGGLLMVFGPKEDQPDGTGSDGTNT
jgi:hypothetical protein